MISTENLIPFLTLHLFSLCACLFVCVCMLSVDSCAVNFSSLFLPYSFPKPLPFPQTHPIQRQFPCFSGPPPSGTNLSELSRLSPVNSALQFTQTLNWPVKSSTEWPRNRIMGLQERIKSGPQDKTMKTKKKKIFPDTMH